MPNQKGTQASGTKQMSRLRWPVLLRLGLDGVSQSGLDRLITLRRVYGAANPALDGFRPDRRHEFVRWLVKQGRLRDR
jgi:hypothetical protein